MNPQAFSACVEADSPCRGALRIAQSTPSQLRGCSGLLARSRVILAAAIAVLLFSSEAPSAFAGDDHNPIGVSGVFEGMITTGCAYNVLSHNARREIDDIVVPGSIGKYPLKMTRYYNSRSTTVSGLMGAGWTHGYQWGWDFSHNVFSYPNGDKLDGNCYSPVGVSDGWEPGNNGNFRLADGGTLHFDNSNGYFQVRTIEDPYGQTTTLAYNNSGFLSRVTEPGGRYLQFTYSQVGGQQVLTQVDAYDGVAGHPRIDYVVYHYASKPTGGNIVTTAVCLTSVDYSDGQHASYTYQEDNAPERTGPICPCSLKLLPLVSGCNDVRYGGPMRRIAYEYPDQGAHGAIRRERYWDGVAGHEGDGAVVSKIDPPAPSPLDTDPNFDTTYTEYRGDGPTRTFIYTDLHLHRFPEDSCPTFRGPAPQQFLQSYTDFQNQNHTTQLHYNPDWYIDKVTDANSHWTQYLRGPPPNAYPGPKGIGEIKKITYQDGTHIDYGYQTESGISGHYVTSITEYTPGGQLRSQTIHQRDANTHKISRTDYKDGDGTPLAYETFTYCDQADGNQCGPVNPTTGQMHGQIKTHKLKNGAYAHYRYDAQGRGLLVDKWEPTWTSSASENDPKTHYDYYGANDPVGGNAWIDRVMTVTGPPTNWPYSSQASETYEYDRALGANGITDLNGAAKAGRGLVTKITHANDTFQRFAYDAYGNKRWEDNELRRVTTYNYDEYNRLLNVTRPLNGITNYTYNPTNGAGSRLSHTTSNPDTVTVRTSATSAIITKNVYDENFRKISSTAADGTASAATTFFHYDAVGNQDYVTDPRGSSTPSTQWTTYTDYDSRNRKWRVREPLARTTQFYYDDGFNVTRIIRADQTTETKAYDGMNRILTDTVPKSQGVNIVTQFQYYPYTVQSASLLKKVIDGENHGSQFEYDAAGLKTKMIYHDNSTQVWVYDDAHNLQSRTTVHGEIQNFAYDNRNRKTAEWWDGFPADGEWRVFGYDDAGHLTLAANGTGAYWTNFIADVRRSYDDAGRLTGDQQTVYVNGVPNAKSVIYPTHDDDGRLTRMYVNGVAGYDYTFGYDDMRRLESIFPTGNQNALFQYSYDRASNETQRYNWSNRVAQIYTPDELNRLRSVEVKNTTTNTRLGIEWYDYYTIGRLHTVTREDNKQDSFTYQLDGELQQATYGVTATPPPIPSPTPTPAPPIGVREPTFSPDGGTSGEHSIDVFIQTATSGAKIMYTKNDLVPPSRTHGTLINASSGWVTLSLGHVTLRAMAYDPNNVLADSDVHEAQYDYDGGQLGSMTPETDGIIPYPLDTAGGRFSQGPMAPELVGTATYTLDKAGNRTSVNGTSYSPNTINQYTSVGGSPVTNGNDHEIQVYGGFTFTYMRDQELTKVTATGLTYEVAYDALGRCVKRTANGDPTYYIYDGDKPILEYRSNGQIARNLYGKGVDEILMRTDPAVNGGQAFYFQQDHEGSTTHLTNWNNGSGQIIERYRYDVFGAPIIYAPNWTQRTTSSYNNRFLFTGREYAGAFVYEYRARVYHSYLGRFMSEDPKGFDAGDYNLFRYCHNDPLDNVDPMGLAGDAINWGGNSPLNNHNMSAMDDRAYNFIMGLMQRQFNSAISAGMAGYQQWSAWSAMQRTTASFRAEVQRGIASGERFAQVGNNVQPPRTVSDSGNLAIDTDGIGPDHGDPTHRNVTSYRPNGRSLNADTDPYVAVPTYTMRQGVRAGDRAILAGNGRSAAGVVGDFGSPGWGEASVAMVRGIGIRIRDVPHIGPVPDTPGGRPVAVTITVYPSAPGP